MGYPHIIPDLDTTTIVKVASKVDDRIIPHLKLPDMKEPASTMDTAFLSYHYAETS